MKFKITVLFRNRSAIVHKGEVCGVRSVSAFYNMLETRRFIQIGDTFINTANIETIDITKL